MSDRLEQLQAALCVTCDGTKILIDAGIPKSDHIIREHLKMLAGLKRMIGEEKLKTGEIK